MISSLFKIPRFSARDFLMDVFLKIQEILSRNDDEKRTEDGEVLRKCDDLGRAVRLVRDVPKLMDCERRQKHEDDKNPRADVRRKSGKDRKSADDEHEPGERDRKFSHWNSLRFCVA